MNFPTPPTFHDPLTAPPPPSTSPVPNPAHTRFHYPISSPPPPPPSSRERQILLNSAHDPYLQNPQSAQQPHPLVLRRPAQQAPPPDPLPPPLTVPSQAPLPSFLPVQPQLPPAMNGMNGAVNMPAGAVVGLPTQVAQQAELNYIYAMVEELSRQLAENKRALEDVVAGVGRVRQRARVNSLGNEELVDAAVEDIHAQEPDMDTLVSLLSEALEKAKFSRDANSALLSQFATVLATMLKQFHEYKSKHVTDVALWHRSYRSQLAEARTENSKLREQIWEMQEHAGRANELLRAFRAHHDEDKARRELAVENKALRQEVRFWKRMALPDVADDDASWSDDDDLIDPEEKRRLRELELEKKAVEQGGAIGMEGGSDVESDEGDGSLPYSHHHQQQNQLKMQGIPQSFMGGVPMLREDPNKMNMAPPPRPSSGSSTASLG